MRMTHFREVLDELSFAKKAARHFAKHPEHSSYGDVKPGNFLALRWGMGDDCVLVLKLDEYFEPTNYQCLIKKFIPSP